MNNVREKLMELLECITGCAVEECRDCALNKNIEQCVEFRKKWLTDKLLANGVTINEWIPVTERLPEEDCFVIVWHDETEIALFSEGKFCFYDAVGCLREYVEVTHWMPLPSAPKGE